MAGKAGGWQGLVAQDAGGEADVTASLCWVRNLRVNRSSFQCQPATANENENVL